MKKKLILFALLLPLVFYAQKKEKAEDKDDFYIIRNDSLTIPLDEVVVIDKRSFTSDKERRYYFWYYKKVHRAYPFATLASQKLSEINEELEGIRSKRKRKKHIKEIQKYMEGEFADQLKKLTRTEGRILIKLVHRQTGETMYELIKEYRSGWQAFWYNSTAKMFKLSLKKEYKPEEFALDFITEDILQRSFINGTLEKQEPELEIDYLLLLDEYRDINVQEVISSYIDKYMK
ncbi:MAG: DUF4294 domain-containing protein [Lutimonas sp.]